MGIEELLDVNDVARITKLSVAAIRKFVLQRQIPYHKLLKAVRFRPSEVDDWITSDGMVVIAAAALDEGDLFFEAAGEVTEGGEDEKC
jgi:predicted DNA-binding transcriptional regulator AlpA